MFAMRLRWEREYIMTSFLSKWTALVLFLLCIHALGLTPQAPRGQAAKKGVSGDAIGELRRAMQLSNASPKNITAAQEACECWSALLDGQDMPSLLRQDRTILGLSLALYGSCLVRIGRDDRAVRVLDEALTLDPNSHELRVTKAQALQRLLKYSEAFQEFQAVHSEVGCVGAATCALRQGDLPGAIDILQNRCRGLVDDEHGAAQGLLGVLKYMQSGDAKYEESLDLITSAAVASEPLYRWIQAVVNPGMPRTAQQAQNCTFLSLLRINLCPLDDPSLLLLDDKVLLHRLLSKYPQRTASFWPSGFVVPLTDDEAIHLNEDPQALYILKERSGYGSHGNRILLAPEVSSSLYSGDNSSADERLLQQMVDPPFLLKGRKFSLRIYVVYFSPFDAYLSRQGLVKLASVQLEAGANLLDSGIHMTNSGRDVAMEQHDLDYLRKYLEQEGESFEPLWARIHSGVENVLRCYLKERTNLDWDARRMILGIPKIMGFDFVIDASLNPWLVEVNRFPGIEPRDETDRKVKEQVIRDTWVCAGDRLGLQEHPFECLLKSISTTGKEGGLERLGLVE